MTSPSFTPRLGWRPGPADHRTLKLGNYLTPQLPAPPPSSDWMRSAGQWPLLGNDRIGDCVFVTCAHLEQAWTAYATGRPVLITERQVVDAYAKVTGYDPRTGRGDNGTQSLDALNFWRRTGIGGRKIVAYVQIDHTDLTEVKTAIHLFGGIFAAADLPLAAQAQFDQRKTWVKTSGSSGRRGSWGGHAFRVGSYGTAGMTASTWARRQQLTYGWWNAYGAEAYTIVSEGFLAAAGGVNPLGVDLDRMLTDLRAITST